MTGPGNIRSNPMDNFTRRHLRNWADVAFFDPDERDDAVAKIQKYLKEFPDEIERYSWPDILRHAEEEFEENPPAHLKKSISLYETFHGFEPRKVGTFPKHFQIPTQAMFAGEAERVLYRSDKLNPETGKDEGVIDYYHDHEGEVGFYRTDDVDGNIVTVPKWICESRSLTALGSSCLGFTYRDHGGKKVKGKATEPFPELYAIPSGKALLVVQDKSDVLAIIWGGDLDVRPEGIVG